MIRLITARMYEGLCAPCQLGIRELLDEAKRHREEMQNSPPQSCYWAPLEAKRARGGYESFSSAERLYFWVKRLDWQASRGGIGTFLVDADVEEFREAEKGLEILRVYECLEALRAARKAAFGEGDVPTNRQEREERIVAAWNDLSRRRLLENADEQFCLAADRRGLRDLADRFAEQQELPSVLKKLEY